MKHSMPTITKIILLFFLAQIIGILILTQYIDFEQTSITGDTALKNDSYIIAPPTVDDETFTFIPIFVAILIATGLIFILIKFGRIFIWRSWFLLSVALTLSFAFYPFVQKLIPSQTIAIITTVILAIILGFLKIYRSNQHVHNITEVCMYGGLAAILVPIINIYSAIVLLLLIAIYDFYMVFVSKHMVTLAQSSMNSKMMAGLWVKSQIGHRIVSKNVPIPLRKRGRPKKLVDPAPHKPYETTSNVIIGGGDIAFPLLFAGAVMKFTGLIYGGIIIAICATLAMSALFVFGKKNTFYPAMPPIFFGCVIGLSIVLLL